MNGVGTIMLDIQPLLERAKELTSKRDDLFHTSKALETNLRDVNHKLYDVEQELKGIEEALVRGIKEEIQCQK